MFIHEAILAKTAEQPYITRTSWAYITSEPVSAPIVILPTDTPDCCIVMSANAKNPCRGWEPQAGDLVADDWITVGLQI